MVEPHHRVTIKDVAAYCGVSTQTVSRVMNDRPDVAAETRERVERAIAVLGYRPSAVARTLVARRSNAIGVLLAGMGYTGTVLTLQGIVDESVNLGLTVLIAELADGGREMFVYLPALLRARRISGVQRLESFLGSDLTYDDFERQRVADFTVEALPAEQVAALKQHRWDRNFYR